MTEITQTSEMPTSGQFIAIWIHDGKLWSDTLRWRGKFLEAYITDDGSLRHDDFDAVDPDFYRDNNAFFQQISEGEE